MPRYTVRSLDVWGNAVDGYNINNQFKNGEVLLRLDASEQEIVEALVHAGHLNKTALEMLKEGSLQVSDDSDGETIIITENDADEAVINGETGELEYDAAVDEERGDRVEEVVGEKPLLNLESAYDPENEQAEPFWRAELTGPTIWELRADREHIEGTRETKRGKKGTLRVESWVDGEFFGTFDFPDDFEDDVVLGIGKEHVLRGQPNEVVGTTKLTEEQTVALEAFLDRGKAMPEMLKVPAVNVSGKITKFIAAQRPENGYAYTVDIDNLYDDGVPVRNWTEVENDTWEQSVVDHSDFGQEVGVVIIDGREYHVWEDIS